MFQMNSKPERIALPESNNLQSTRQIDVSRKPAYFIDQFARTKNEVRDRLANKQVHNLGSQDRQQPFRRIVQKKSLIKIFLHSVHEKFNKMDDRKILRAMYRRANRNKTAMKFANKWCSRQRRLET